MLCNIRQYFAILFYLCLTTNAHACQKSQNKADVLKRVLGKPSNKPVVVYVNLDKQKRSSDFDDLFTVQEDDGLLSDDYDYTDRDAKRASHKHDYIHKSDNAYFLYHLLKNVLDNDDASSSSEESLQPTKQVLRAALRARCERVDDCVRECPPRRPVCPINCQQVFDNLNLCPPPRRPPTTRDPCWKPKCGRTMPPKWRL